MTIKIDKHYALILLFSMIVAAFTKDLFMVNTADFFRVSSGVMEAAPAFDDKLTLSYHFWPTFLPFYMYDYKSSFTTIVYFYSLFVSLFTDYFDLRIFSLISKTIYFSTLFTLYRKIVGEIDGIKFSMFFLALLPLLSSSNLSMFSTLYQEQVLLIFWPLLLISLISKNKKTLPIMFLSLTAISCAKSQFFFLPLLVVLTYIIYNRELLVTKIILCMLSFILAIICIKTSISTVELNKYHSTYFGTYEYIKNNEKELPDTVDKNCVGIDSWGNKFSITDGAIKTNLGESCQHAHSTESFVSSIKYFILNPKDLILLPLDAGVKSQLTEKYFHVYKRITLIVNDNNLFGYLTALKDKVFHSIRFWVCLILLLSSLALRNFKSSSIIFLTSIFGTSQFYASFFGEGYRDLSKHLFPMNLSFDLLLFILTSTILVNIFKYKSKPLPENNKT